MEPKKGRGRPKTGKVLFKRWVSASLAAEFTAKAAAEEGKPVVAQASAGPTEADGLKAEVARLTKLNKEATDSIGRMAEEIAALQAELAWQIKPIGFGAPLPTYIKFVKQPSQWDQTAE